MEISLQSSLCTALQVEDPPGLSLAFTQWKSVPQNLPLSLTSALGIHWLRAEGAVLSQDQGGGT